MAADTLRSAVNRMRTRLAANGRTPTDRELLERFVRQHDEDAFADLVRRHERLVHSALMKVLSDPTDVEDAFQATFLVLVRKARSVKWQANLGTWLYAVAHRVAVHLRGAARKRSRGEGEAAARKVESTAAPDLSWREVCQVLHAELDKLPDKFRLPLLLCYLEGKSRDEAAEQLGLSAGTIKGRLERGRNLLRDRLARRGITLSAGLLALAHSATAESQPRLIEAAQSAASGTASARIAVLAQGVVASMILSRAKLFGASLLAAGLICTLLTTGRTPPIVASTPPAAEAPKSTQPSEQPPTPRPDAKPPAQDEANKGPFNGRVVGPDGGPVANVSVRLVRPPVLLGKEVKFGLLDEATTEPDGTYCLNGPEARIEGGEFLVASADGFGCEWLPWTHPRRDGEVLQLAKDHPISGRVIDLEGRPVLGATARVIWIDAPMGDDLKTYYAKDAKGLAPRTKWLLSGSLLPSGRLCTTTDAVGRFHLSGIGAERVAGLLIEGPHIAT